MQSLFSGSDYLITLYTKINELPTRNDIKCLLHKCVYAILADENVEEELQFLREMKNLLNQIRVISNPEHVEIIEVINEIYSMAIDKKLDELNCQKGNKMVIERDILALFETDDNIFESSREEVDDYEEEAQGTEEDQESFYEADDDPEEQKEEEEDEICEVEESVQPYIQDDQV